MVRKKKSGEEKKLPTKQGQRRQEVVIEAPVREVDRCNLFEREVIVNRSTLDLSKHSMPSIDIEAQKSKLLELFPGINLSYVDALVKMWPQMPNWADTIALVPTLLFLSRHFGIKHHYKNGYPSICNKLLKFLSGTRNFINLRGLYISPKEFYIHPDVLKVLRRVEISVLGDVLVLPVNFGYLYAGRSARNARCEAISCNHLPLNTVQAACLLLTMPTWLCQEDDLFVYCSGDKWIRHDDGFQWELSSCFIIEYLEDDLVLEYVTGEPCIASKEYGSPILILPDKLTF